MTTLSNGPGYIDIRAPSGAINLLASNTVYAGGAQFNTSNVGNSLGTFVPFRGYYEPPTGAGQAIELQIEGHAADAGARFLLTYGCSIASGESYLVGSWPGYILTPMTIYGQQVSLHGSESVYIDALSGNITQTATAAINLVAGGDINIQGANIALSNLSSINGVAYTGGGSTWVSTATTDLNMNGYNIGTASGSNLSIISSSNLTLATGLQSLVFNQGSLVATLSNGVGSVDIIAPTTNITSSNINLYGNVGTTGTLYMNSNNIEQIRCLYFQTTGNIASAQSGGINYLYINAPADTGSGNARLRIVVSKGRLDFDDNVNLAGNGSNYVCMYNQYGYFQLAADQNCYIGGGGGSIGGVSAVNLNGLTIVRHNGSYAGGLITQIVNQAAAASTPGNRYGTLAVTADNPAATGESGAQITLETANYGGAIFGGITQGVGSFISLATNNGAGGQTERMRISGVSGYVGIGTTTPGYKLDVVGDARVSGDLLGNGGQVHFDGNTFIRGTGSNYIGLNNFGSAVIQIEPSQNIVIRGNGAANYLTIDNAGTAIQFAGPNIYMTTSSGGLNIVMPVTIGGCNLYTQGGIIDLGGTSSNNAYISGLNHIYGNPTSSGGYFGGLVVDYAGGFFFNGGSNDAAVYTEASSHTLFMRNAQGDILIDATTHGFNIYGAGMNINTTLNMNTSNIYNIGSIQNNTSRLDINTSNGLKLTDLATGGSGTFTIDASNHLYWNGTLIA